MKRLSVAMAAAAVRERRNAPTGDVQDNRMILVGFCQSADKQGPKISDIA
jgi:hypothetical protein